MRLGLLVPSKLMRLSGTEEHALVQTYSPQQWHDFARYKCKTVNIAKKLEKIKKLPNFWETITRVALYSFFLPPITGDAAVTYEMRCVIKGTRLITGQPPFPCSHRYPDELHV